MKKNMKKQLFVLCLVLLVTGTGSVLGQNRPQRVPAIRTPIEQIQPNGDTLLVRLHGDERHHCTTTLDGYLIKTNRKGYYCYAKEKKDGTIIATNRIAHNEEDRTRCERRYIGKYIPQPYKPYTEEKDY